MVRDPSPLNRLTTLFRSSPPRRVGPRAAAFTQTIQAITPARPRRGAGARTLLDKDLDP